METAQWEAIIHCDPAFDGEFYYAVSTTNIFCRPSCRSRTPKQENVQIFSTSEGALAAGFRPCKRCCPTGNRNESDTTVVEGIKRVVRERYSHSLRLNEVAAQLYISPFHLHRLFKRNTGMTVGEYLRQVRLEQAKEMLKTRQPSIAEAALAVGFRSISHFTALFQKAVGCTPSKYRNHYSTIHQAGETRE